MVKNVKRSYTSVKRRRQAEATQQAILHAARTLFVANGYTATTIQAIADEADVAVQTVYAIFSNKRNLLDQLIEKLIVGDDDAGDLTSSAQVQAIAKERDPRRRAEMDAAMSRAITERITPIIRVAREAAASDPEFATVFEEIKARRRKEMTSMVRVLAGKDQLRVSAPQAAATLYVLYSPDVADMLLVDYGWSAARYEKWLADMLFACLLADDAGGSGPFPHSSRQR